MSVAASTGILPVDPAEFAAVAAGPVADGEPLVLRIDGAECEVRGDLASAVVALCQATGEGRSVNVTALPEMLTTGQAADVLGVSRPTVVALVDRGDMPATRFGTHRRIRTVDLLAYQADHTKSRREAVDEMVALSEQFGLYED